MNWTTCTIFFPEEYCEHIDGRWFFRQDYYETLVSRYAHDTTTDTQVLDGIEVSMSPAESVTVAAFICRDDNPLKQFRPVDQNTRTLPMRRVEDGCIVNCGFSAELLSDLARDPQPEPELFDGVYVVEDGV